MAKHNLKCVLVHGWGMNKAVWTPVLEHLPDWIEPVTIDLPGHGEQADQSFDRLDDLVDAIVDSVDEPALWLGWSLGGLVVTQLALRYPEKIRALMLMSTSPCFVEKPDWPCGMRADVFDGFADELEKDFSGTIQRFLSLQVQGSDTGRQILRQLRKQMMAQPEANRSAMHSGLQVLKDTDLRNRLTELTMPVSWLLGGRDALVKLALAEQLPQLNKDIDIHIIRKSAHAPFLSHLQEFCDTLTGFAKQIHDTTG